MDTVIYYIYIGIILLISIGLHEYAHAYVSYKFGDPTPKLQGRLTPNPLKHIDIIGFVSIFLIGFGRGKPVQINPTYYKKPLRDELMSSLAGPGMNLLLATGGMILMMLYAVIVGMPLSQLLMYQFDLVTLFRFMFITVNLSLAVFNLLPIFPLDGYRLVKIVRNSGAQRMEKHAMIISLLLLILILGPGSNMIGQYISFVSDAIYRALFTVFSLIFY